MRRRFGVAVALVLGAILVAGCGGGGEAFPTGQWTAANDELGEAGIDYRSDGTWVFSADGAPISTGRYSTDGNTISFETDPTCKLVGAEQGTYTWTDENNELTLKKQTDLCESRVGVLDGVVWVQVK